jgi:hypothetical protein
MSVALPTKRVTLDGVTFELTTLPGTKAYALWLRILKALGPGLDAVSEKDGEAAVLKALAGALRSLSLEDAEAIRESFAAYSKVETAPGQMPSVASVFDFQFAGKPKLVGKWLFECIKLNFADFLDESFANAIRQLFAAQAQSAARSQTT